ncbi:MAG: A/G-specific adenine glycosylase [Bacteroidetes bacterium]|nr:MAG: A/G-specific adenine glycosylase [Bacteroidota bacterium]
MLSKPKQYQFFSTTLLHWHAHHNTRQMPWKGETDPYKIWLSEVILQQTQVAQGWAYYLRFVAQYPTVQHLAIAPHGEVYKLWEGLGYYSRCKNLLAAAQQVTKEFGGVFPNTYAQLLQLKGVGAYTAAAIASFAFGLPHAVVDGNVLRLLSRFFYITLPIDSTEGKQVLTSMAQALMVTNQAAAYNQAIMDFGATVCKPKQPLCGECVFSHNCQALAKQTVQLLPAKAKKAAKKTRWFCYLVVRWPAKGLVLARQRGPGDVWENLWEYALLEDAAAFDWTDADMEAYLNQWLGTQARVLYRTPVATQQLTHQSIHCRFVVCEAKGPKKPPLGFEWIPMANVEDRAWPRSIASFNTQTGPQAFTLF